MCHPRDHLPQPGEAFALHQLALRIFQLLMRLPLGLHRLLQHFLGVLDLGHVSANGVNQSLLHDRNACP